MFIRRTEAAMSMVHFSRVLWRSVPSLRHELPNVDWRLLLLLLLLVDCLAVSQLCLFIAEYLITLICTHEVTFSTLVAVDQCSPQLTVSTKVAMNWSSHLESSGVAHSLNNRHWSFRGRYGALWHRLALRHRLGYFFHQVLLLFQYVWTCKHTAAISSVA